MNAKLYLPLIAHDSFGQGKHIFKVIVTSFVQLLFC